MLTSPSLFRAPFPPFIAHFADSRIPINLGKSDGRTALLQQKDACGSFQLALIFTHYLLFTNASTNAFGPLISSPLGLAPF